MTNRCYECGAAVLPADIAEFERALKEFHASREMRGQIRTKSCAR